MRPAHKLIEGPITDCAPAEKNGQNKPVGLQEPTLTGTEAGVAQAGTSQGVPLSGV